LYQIHGLPATVRIAGEAGDAGSLAGEVDGKLAAEAAAEPCY